MINAAFKPIGNLALRVIENGGTTSIILYNPNQMFPDRMIFAYLKIGLKRLFYTVETVAARNDYGPTIYLLGMYFTGDHGLAPAIDCSPAAKRVWKKFYEDNINGGIIRMEKIENRSGVVVPYLSYTYHLENCPLDIASAMMADDTKFPDEELQSLATEFFDKQYILYSANLTSFLIDI